MNENNITTTENQSNNTVEVKDEKKSKTEKTLTIILICVTILTLLFNAFVAQLAQVNGNSMKPTLNNRELLLVSKLDSEFERGDIIVFNWNGKHLIKRLIALPGETVQIKENAIYINDVKIDDYINVQMEEYGDLSEKITLQQNEYIFLGDNRNDSIDSRSFGVITKDKIVGKVILRFSPWTTY